MAVHHVAAMVSMAKSPEEIKEDMPMAIAARVKEDQPIYPWGLCLKFSEDELEKLNLDNDCDVGDMIHIFALARVTSKSETSTDNGSKCNIELQIEQMAVENEDEENDEEDTQEHNEGRMSRRYNASSSRYLEDE